MMWNQAKSGILDWERSFRTAHSDTAAEVNPMKISARNILPGTVTAVTKGAVNAEIALTLRGGETIVGVITNASVDRLGLEIGTNAFVIIKASEVMVGKDLENAKLSARNILAGKVAELQDGAVNSEVGIRLPGGTMLIASITRESVQGLDLKLNDAVSAVVKASHVMVGI
jgi:molybdate transport system regulatory protein